MMCAAIALPIKPPRIKKHASTAIVYNRNCKFCFGSSVMLSPEKTKHESVDRAPEKDNAHKQKKWAAQIDRLFEEWRIWNDDLAVAVALRTNHMVGEKMVSATIGTGYGVVWD